MSYEVRKTIRGRDYRYAVESYRDPGTGKVRNRWRYLGRAQGPAPQRRGRAGETRVRLAAALERLLARIPWSEITVQAIATEAGVTRATLYRHFSSRDDVREACAKECDARLDAHVAELHQLAPDANSERDRLRAWTLALAKDAPRAPIASDWNSQRRRAFERYFELLAVNAYATVAPRDRPGRAMALALMFEALSQRAALGRAPVRDGESAALWDAIERLIFA